MVQEEVALRDRRFEEYVRVLSASVNTRIMHWLVEARRKEPTQGWRFLSEIAEGIGESPGAVSPALQKLLPLLEERREKGKRYFRARAKLRLLLDFF
jgi:DNA-binding transcriptional ArsR family regulator